MKFFNRFKKQPAPTPEIEKQPSMQTVESINKEDVEGGGVYAGEPMIEEREKEKETTGRRGHLLFYFICDMRIAVVFLNIMNICLLLLSSFIGIYKFGWGTLLVIFPGLVLSGIAIYGAMNFELWALVMATIGFLLGLLSDFWYLNWIGIAFGMLVCYPHVVLTYEIKEGILNKETYNKQEEFVCDEAKEYVEGYVEL
jgi:hypothetical protein